MSAQMAPCVTLRICVWPDKPYCLACRWVLFSALTEHYRCLKHLAPHTAKHTQSAEPLTGRNMFFLKGRNTKNSKNTTNCLKLLLKEVTFFFFAVPQMCSLFDQATSSWPDRQSLMKVCVRGGILNSHYTVFSCHPLPIPTHLSVANT